MQLQTETVSMASILCMSISLLVCFGVPVGLMIWAKVKYKKEFSFLPLLGGALGFFISQILFRIPVMQYLLPLFGWYKALVKMPWLYVTFLALTAGIVEEFARFIVFAIMKKRRKYPDGLSYGIGHGGIEAILLVGMAFINNIVYSIMINAGGWGKLVSSLPQALQSQYVQAGQVLVTADPTTFLLGGAERLFTIVIQIALSMVVLKGFMTNRKWLYLVAAVLLHALVDFPAGAFGLKLISISPLAMEAIVLAFAVIGLVFIVREARNWQRNRQLPEETVSV